jgi:RND family efflux transporter MFP subunit
MQKKQIIFMTTGLVTIGLFVGYCRVTKPLKSRPSVNPGAMAPGGANRSDVPLFLVEKKRFSDSIDNLVGTIKGDTIELTFNGQEERLSTVHVRVGQLVRKGQVLFELDHIKALARKNQAESIYQRAQELQAVGGATSHDVEEARSAFAMARKDYEDTFVYAPKSGHISQVNKQVGEAVNRSDVVGVLVSSEDRLFLETGVIEGQLDRVAAGQTAAVQIEAFGSQKILGNVTGVSREVTTTGRTGTVIIALPGSVQSKLRPGLSARCDIMTVDREAYVIPRQAYDQDKKGVYGLDANGKAQFKPVQIGHVTRDYYEVLDGLKDGDKIVADIALHPVEPGADLSAVGELARYVPRGAENTNGAAGQQ